MTTQKAKREESDKKNYPNPFHSSQPTMANSPRPF
ncbi:hypothetical protein NUACC26_015290 [Scytonema sp. NUACC26]